MVFGSGVVFLNVAHFITKHLNVCSICGLSPLYIIIITRRKSIIFAMGELLKHTIFLYLHAQ